MSGGPYGIALLILLLLLLHSAAVGIPYLLHYYDNIARGNEKRPSTNGYLRAYVVEWFFALVVHVSYVFGIPGGGVSGRFDPRGGPPIILCHGFFMNRSCFFAFYWRLRRAGFRNVHVINLRPLISPLEEQAERLARLVRLVSTAADGQPVIGIGHSQGGLLFRWVATEFPGVPLRQIITLGSPHHGTRLAYFGLGPNARQMQPGSKALEALGEDVPVPLTAVYSDLDHFINPAESAKLGADNRFFAETGHFALLYRAEVFDAIVTDLAEQSVVPAAAPVG